MNPKGTQLYQFGPFQLDAGKRRLKRLGEVVPLTPKAFETLLVFVESNGTILEKEELMNRLWPDTFVEESNLAFQVSVLRKALGESPSDHRYIVTIPGRGYRFLEEVREASSENELESAEEAAVSQQRLDMLDPGSGTGEFKRPDSQSRLGELAVASEGPLESSNQETRSPFLTVGATNGTSKATTRWKHWRLWLPVLCAVLLSVLVWQWSWITRRKPDGGTAVPQITTLAVLPLKNLTGEPGQEYFVDGMTEALGATFSQISALKVISSTSVMRYKNTTKSVPQIAQELGGVDALVEGAVQQSGSRVRVTAALVQAASDRRIWTAVYERDAANVFALYADVAQVVAREISIAVSPPDRARLAKPRVVKPEAYNAYLRGSYFRNRWMGGGCIEAERYFLKAVDLDPDFPQPYADLAWCSVFPDRLQRSIGELGPKARFYAARAVELDPTLGSAQLALALISQRLDFDWDTAGKHFSRALATDRNLAQAYISYGEYLYMRGQADEGVAFTEQALKLDPFSLDCNVGLGFALKNVRRYDAAIEQFRKTLELEPTYSTAQLWLAETYALKGSYAASVTEYLRWLDQVLVRERAPTARAALERAYAGSGWLGFWRRELDLSKEEADRPGTVYKAPYGRYCGPFYMARRYARVGDRDQAVSALEKAYEARHHLMVFLKVEPIFDGLSADPRFRDLIRRVGLTP